MSTAKESDGAFSKVAMPVGEILHAQLKTAYVDFSSLLGDLAKTNFSGYVSLEAGDRQGVVLFQNGNAVDALCAQSSQRDLSQVAMAELNVLAREKLGSLNVVRTSPELAASCVALFHGEALHDHLDAQAVRLDGLLKSLEENRLTGCIAVQANGAGAGYYFLYEGANLGAYYREHEALARDDARVENLVGEGGAMISVFAAPSRREPISLATTFTARSHAWLLAEVIRRCLHALTELAGMSMVNEYFQGARSRAVKTYPWLEGLTLQLNGKLDSELDLKNVPLDDALAGIAMVLNDCRERGIALFGEKAIRAGFEKQLAEMHPQLIAMGFPENWP